MTLYAYNAYLRFVATVEHKDDCPAGCEVTTQEPPQKPWPDGHWPYFVDDAWEMAEVLH